MIYQKQKSGDHSVNIQAGRDVVFNFDINDIAPLMRKQFEELFERLSQSDNRIKSEIISKINSNQLDEARELTAQLVEEITQKASQDFLDIANLYSILEPSKSERFYQKAIEENPECSGAINAYAVYLMNSGDLNKAKNLFNSSLTNIVLPSIDREKIIGNLGVLYKNNGEFDKSIENLKNAIALSKSNKNKIGQVKHLNNLGSCYNNIEEYSKAEVYLNESLALVSDLLEEEQDKALKKEMRRIKSNILTNIAIGLRYLWFKSSDREYLIKAEGVLNQAIDIAELLEEEVELSRHYGNISNIYRQLGERSKCMEYIQKSLTLSENNNDLRGEVCGLLNIGLAHFDDGDNAIAKEYFEKSLDKESNQYPKLKAHIFSNLALLHKADGNKSEARNYFDKAIELYKQLGLNDSLLETTQSFERN